MSKRVHNLLHNDLARLPRQRVVVAMSGGVDSSVVAALLTRAGHEVIGVTLQLYDHGAATARAGACCAGQDIHDARRAADHLGIPHYVLDFEERFRQTVMRSFASSYMAGETPIPCVTCNQRIKFEDLLATATDLGADVLATGHYIELIQAADGPRLYRPADAARDQSYFMFATTRAQLQRLTFPLGSLTKSEVRDFARDLGLPVADKPDSQDICFVPQGRYGDIIERLDPAAATPGDIVHVDGRVMGQHRGIVHFTVGQRRGLGLAEGEPLYVVALDPTTRRVVVGPRERLVVNRLALRDVNWIGDGVLAQAAAEGLDMYARVRSSQSPRPARLSQSRDGIEVQLLDGEPGVAKGQACVLYESGSTRARLLGGGFIAATSCDVSALQAAPLAAS
jgi:tRNA-specific 2-thiouridylase